MDAFITYLYQNYTTILDLLMQHLQLTFTAVVVAIVIGVPIGLIISRYSTLTKPVLGVINIIQAIPSMAALGFMIPFFGIGETPAIIMVMLYALLPIVKNSSTGLMGISPETLEVARGIGMTGRQVLFKIQFPLAMPVIMAGVRISAVNAVGLMTLAAYIGAGGLGYLIYSGVQMVNSNMILAGAIPACLLALAMDWIFSVVEKWVTPISLRPGAKLPENMQQVVSYNKTKKMGYRIVLGTLATCFAVYLATTLTAVPVDNTIVVTSKYYPEQMILGNMACELISAHTDLTVEKKLNMGGTDICFSALTSGDADVMIEYTGTMYASVLQQSVADVEVDEIFTIVQTMYDEEYDLTVFDHWGFNNTYSIAVRQETADYYGLTTISDLAKVDDQIIFSPTIEFSNREDGLLGVNRVYGTDFKEVVPMDGGLRYTAIDNKEVDAIIVYTTDAQIYQYGLVQLEDDLEFFLPYNAVPVIREDTLAKYPELKEVLNILTNELTEDIMCELNYQVEVLEMSAEEVARTFLTENGYI